MSLALIQESAKEVRRLSIAGSTLAVGDFRLKKLIGPLEQAGTNVPVFAQVAKAIGDLVNGKETDSAAHLLNLSTLVNAILYTQGQTGTTGDFQELSVSGASSCTTRTAARVLKPIIEALTTSGGGRFEIVKAAVDRGAFNDLRLIEPSIRALDDSYPELADLVADKILPGYGPCIIPLLKPKLDLKGKRSDARRLTILHRLDPAGTIELCKAALEDGSPEVKVAAIACLGKHEECLALVLGQAPSKNKVVREAALVVLAVHDRPEITKLFIEMIQGKSLELVVEAVRLVKSRDVFDSLLEEASKALERAFKNDGPAILQFFELLQCLEGRKDSATEEFLLACLDQSGRLTKIKVANSVVSGSDLMRELTELLFGIGSPRSLKAILDHQDKVPLDSFQLVLYSALRTWPPKKVFDEFAPLLGQKQRPGKDKAEVIEQAIRVATQREPAECTGENGDGADKALQGTEWDPRWLDAAIKADQQMMVCFLARPDHKRAIAYLVKLLGAKSQTPTEVIFEALARCQYPKLADLYIELVKKKTKRAQYLDWELQQLFGTARFLPPADLPKLDAFAGTLDEKFVDAFLEALAPLRQAKSDGSDSSDGPSTVP